MRSLSVQQWRRSEVKTTHLERHGIAINAGGLNPITGSIGSEAHSHL